VKYGFIVRHRSIWLTRLLCRALGVSHGAFAESMHPRKCETVIDKGA
jgi:putative transposase